MQDLIQECKLSFYKELYRFDDTGYTLIINETTGELFLKKELATYNISVYEYLKAHQCKFIPHIEEYYEAEGKLIVYEEYVQGEKLSELMESNILAEAEKLKLLNMLCEALDFLHNATPPIIHRDVKAQNIIITNDGY